ncbi:MAG: multiubiquitin domain-containing protein [Candidatus Bathyarchaeia archaeon]
MSETKTHKYELIVNGRPKPWNEDKISYSQAVDLAFPPPHKDTEIFTVQYSHGPKENRQGTLVQGQPAVVVKGGMVFDITRTDKS